MAHWLQKVIDLFQAETSDLRRLAELAGGDPKTFYKGANLNGVDVRGQDLRGMHFTTLEGADIILDQTTKMDRKYKNILSNQIEIFDTEFDLYSEAEEIVSTASDGQQELPFPKVASTPFSIARRIRELPREESRLAALFDVLLSDEKHGLSVLESHFGITKFESSIISLLKTELSHLSDQATTYRAVMESIDFAITHVYPLRKGELLLIFAQRLAKHPDVRTLIEKRLRKLQAENVSYYRQEILYALRTS